MQRTYAQNGLTVPSARTLATAALAAAIGLSLPTIAHAEGVPAGTPIENTATATYTIGGVDTTVNSNTVIITVDELLDVTVTPLDGGTVGLGADGGVLSFNVTNIGNGPEAFAITFDEALAGDDFDPAITEVAYDSNGNGVYDAGVDAVIPTGGSTPILDPDQPLLVFVVGALANNPADGDLANVALTATADTGSGTPGTVFTGAGEGGSDAVVGNTTAIDQGQGTFVAQVSAVTLSKSASIVDPFGTGESVPGAVVTYTLTASVSGSASVTGLVVTDPIPTGTTYDPDTLVLDTGRLTDAAGDDAGSASDAAGISVDLGTVAGGTDHVITFNVIID